MTKSTAWKRIASAVCAAILAVVFSFSSIAAETTDTTESEETEYTYNKIVWNLAKNTEAYGGQLNGVVQANASGVISGSSLSVPLTNSSFNRLYLGVNYPKLLNDFESQAIFKMVITLTVGATGKYTGDGNVQLFNSTLDGNCIARTGRQSLSTKPTLTKGANTSYTFTWDNIEYDKIVDYPFIYADFPTSEFTNSPADQIYIAGMYFGLSSYYDDDKYKAEVMENIKEISGKIDDVKDAVDGVGNKVDEAADQISGDLDELQQSIENQPQEEMDIADQKGSDASGAADAALNDSGLTPQFGNLWAGLKTLFSSISTTETVSYIPIPEVKLPSLSVGGSSTPETVLIEEQQYDISQLLQNEWIQKLISAAKVLYYIFFAIFIVDYCRKLLAKIGLGDVNTKDNGTSKSSGSDANLY